MHIEHGRIYYIAGNDRTSGWPARSSSSSRTLHYVGFENVEAKLFSRLLAETIVEPKRVSTRVGQARFSSDDREEISSHLLNFACAPARKACETTLLSR